jgi:hypothetical protein
MSEESSKPPHLPRHLMIPMRPKGVRYVMVFEWMTKLPISPPAVIAYATLVSFTVAKMKKRVSDVSKFCLRSSRSVRRYLGELERAGLIVRQARYTAGKRIANAYVLLWHPVMPVELKGPLHGATSVTVEAVTAGTRRCDTSDRVALPPVSVQFRNAARSAEHAGNSNEASEPALPDSVVLALAKAAPGQTDDCLRVLADACSDLEPAHAWRAKLVAVRKLVDRCQRKDVANPAGLLRACIAADAKAEFLIYIEACERLRAAILRDDQLIGGSRSGWDVLRRMRKRALDARTYEAQHESAFGVPPEEVMLAIDDAELAEVLAEVARLQDLVRFAREKGDAMAANHAEEGLHQIERRLDDLIQKRGVRHDAGE